MRRKQAATMSDVAREAGVALGTVVQGHQRPAGGAKVTGCGWKPPSKSWITGSTPAPRR